MNRFFTLVGFLLLTQTASAQFSNPWGGAGAPNPWHQNIQPIGSQLGRQNGLQATGGTRFVNPWAPQQIQPIVPAAIHNLQVQYTYATLMNASLYSYQPLWNTNRQAYGNGATMLPGIIPGINGGGTNTPGESNDQPVPPNSRLQVEVGRFVPVARDIYANPISGTVLSTRRGVALTREGAFYRLPGTGSLTAWGAFIPGSGVYVNPLTGAAYDPVTGLIAR
jgi:hypothetical protein